MAKYDSCNIRSGIQKLNTRLEKRLMNILMDFGASVGHGYDDGDYDTAMELLLSVVVPEQKHPSEDTIQVVRMLVYTGPRRQVERTLALARSAVKRFHVAGRIEIAEAILGEVPTILANQSED